MAKKTSKKPAKKAPAKSSAKKAVKKAASKKTPVKPAAKKTAPKKAAPKKAAKKSPAKKSANPTAAPAKRPLSLTVYLTFPGNCEEVFNFYRSVFGGQFIQVSRFKDMPADPNQPIPPSELNKIMHISMPIGNTELLGSDSSEAFGHVDVKGNNFSISLNVPGNTEADKIYSALSAGGKATMPMSSTFWGSYFGMLTDKFGIQWMLSA